MQSCKFYCLDRLNAVPYSAYRNMYLDHVYCPTCEAYFKKPFPDFCVCCNNRVRYKRRGKKTKVPLYTKLRHGGGNKWIVADILAAKAAGRL